MILFLGRSLTVLMCFLCMGLHALPASAEAKLSFVFPAIAYQPRNFSPGAELDVTGKRQVFDELQLLHQNGFRSLVTYSAKGVLGMVPELARIAGFNGTVILGVWDILSEEEWANALAQQPFVNGYCLGNEGLGVRYTTAELEQKMIALRNATGLPVTTTEPIDSYLQGPYQEWLLAHSDWLFPLATPFWAAQYDPKHAVGWIVARYDFLVTATGREVVLKEAGLPTAVSHGQNENAQVAFFEALESTGVPFFYFEAFDQPWKHDVLGESEFEAHWGLYDSQGQPKKVIQWLLDRKDYE